MGVCSTRSVLHRIDDPTGRSSGWRLPKFSYSFPLVPREVLLFAPAGASRIDRARFV